MTELTERESGAVECAGWKQMGGKYRNEFKRHSDTSESSKVCMIDISEGEKMRVK